MKKKSVLVVAAHPDDEVLGCGATIIKHAKLGDAVHILILAEGLTSRDKKRDLEKRGSGLEALAKAARKASSIMGTKSLTLHKFPDNRMDSVDLLEVVKVIETHVSDIKPEIVYTHHCGDINIDHRVTHQAVITACRPLPGLSVKTLLFFEILSSTEWQVECLAVPFVPNWFIDITDTLDAKIKALEAYRSEMCVWPHPRSYEAVKHLAMYRGCSVGYEAAEAFILGRNLLR